MRRVIRTVLVVFLVAGLSPAIQAEGVEATLPSGTLVTADFTQGDPALPAILVLHGFLQTREFQATKNIIDGLSETGHAVLGPSLSLGVAHRRKSLPCEAPHTHALESDLKEVDFWVHWLLGRGYGSVILVGHSWGGQHALAYRANYPARPIEAVMAVSLVRARQDAATLTAQYLLARSRMDDPAKTLHAYALNFCRNYTATPQSYLSYAEWTDEKVVAAVRATEVPVHVILGGSDRRIDDAWLSALEASGAHVSKIDGADHFFSSQYEFDLLDALIEGLDEIRRPESGEDRGT